MTRVTPYIAICLVVFVCALFIQDNALGRLGTWDGLWWAAVKALIVVAVFISLTIGEKIISGVSRLLRQWIWGE